MTPDNRCPRCGWTNPWEFDHRDECPSCEWWAFVREDDRQRAADLAAAKHEHAHAAGDAKRGGDVAEHERQVTLMRAKRREIRGLAQAVQVDIFGDRHELAPPPAPPVRPVQLALSLGDTPNRGQLAIE